MRRFDNYDENKGLLSQSISSTTLASGHFVFIVLHLQDSGSPTFFLLPDLTLSFVVSPRCTLTREIRPRLGLPVNLSVGLYS